MLHLNSDDTMLLDISHSSKIARSKFLLPAITVHMDLEAVSILQMLPLYLWTSVLLLNEQFKGVDVATTDTIYKYIKMTKCCLEMKLSGRRCQKCC